MDNPAEASFDFSVEQIADDVRTWTNFNDFSGETCGECKKTANVLAGGPGWICVCGHFNAQGNHFHRTPHPAPDLGPSQATIQEGSALAHPTSP